MATASETESAHDTKSLQVAERTLFLWNNETVVVRITEHRERVIPIVFGALTENTAGHWNSTVHGEHAKRSQTIIPHSLHRFSELGF